MDFLTRDSDSSPNATRVLVTKIHDRVLNIPNNIFTGKAVALESLSDTQRQHVSQTSQQIEVALEEIRNELCLEKTYTRAQIDAAQQAGIMAGNWDGFRRRGLRDAMPATDSKTNVVTIESFGVADVMQERSYATEAYDERDNRSAVAYSITYNLQSSRQDEFGEALFPTVTIPADQAGVSITSNMMLVMDNVDRDISGAFYDTKRRNVLRAVADPTVLRKDQTLALPVFRSQSEDKFVDEDILPTTTVDLEGVDITTSALLFSKQIGLLDISQTDAMLAAGVQNQTDSLDPAIEITSFYVSTGADATFNLLKFNTENLPYFNFTPNSQGDYKLLTLMAETNSLMLNDQSLQADGTALVAPLNQIVTQHLIIRFHALITGNVRTDTGNIGVYGNVFEVHSITNASGVSIALTDGSVTALVAALNDITWVGYNPKAYRSNQNRRQQGQFVDVTKEFQRYMVPLRSPITARHPAHIDGQIDASDVQALITTTRIRLANEAVTSILQSNDLLAAFIDVRDNLNEAPAVLGVGRHFVRPAYISRDFDAELEVDSLKSHERPLDIQAALINHIRDIVYTLYRNSEYKAASDALYGGNSPMPKVVIATDPYTARYMMVVGDIRTLGGEFDVMVVSTLDIRFRGKIIITFGIFDAERNSSINPLNNGNLLWAPELVLTANIGRGGQYSRETLVQPRYRFIQNLPVMGMLTVTNIPNIIGRIPLQFTDVTP
ncbi:MAG TPA: hypothetical protein VN843_36075 [Anaerolineales bacterium]|nr:hypothetical protein [Anaerolineales bacterium]